MLLFSLPLSDSSAHNIYNPVIKTRAKLNNSLTFLIKLSNSKLIHKHSCWCRFALCCSTKTSVLHRQTMMEEAGEIRWTSRSSWLKNKGDHTFAVFPLHEILEFFFLFLLDQIWSRILQSLINRLGNTWTYNQFPRILLHACLSSCSDFRNSLCFCLYRALMSADDSRLHGLLFLNFKSVPDFGYFIFQRHDILEWAYPDYLCLLDYRSCFFYLFYSRFL